MKKIALFMVLVFCISFVSVYGISVFDDIDNHWARDYIINLYNLGIIDGYEDNTFRPENRISNVEFIKLILCISGLELEMDKNYWGKNYIDYAINHQLLPLKILLKPDEKIRRKDVSYMLYSLFFVNSINDINTHNFKDAKSIESEYKDKINWCYNMGFLIGDDKGNFRPDDFLSRAEACTLAMRVFNYLQNTKTGKDETIIDLIYMDIELPKIDGFIVYESMYLIDAMIESKDMGIGYIDINSNKSSKSFAIAGFESEEYSIKNYNPYLSSDLKSDFLFSVNLNPIYMDLDSYRTYPYRLTVYNKEGFRKRHLEKMRIWLNTLFGPEAFEVEIKIFETLKNNGSFLININNRFVYLEGDNYEFRMFVSYKNHWYKED